MLCYRLLARSNFVVLLVKPQRWVRNCASNQPQSGLSAQTGLTLNTSMPTSTRCKNERPPLPEKFAHLFLECQ
jgi:hypothetical protein